MALPKYPPGNSRYYGTNPIVVSMIFPVVVDVIVLRYPLAYLPLYNTTARAIKSVNPLFQVGGPSTAMLCWVEEFLNATLTDDIHLDFISTHSYPGDYYINQTIQIQSFGEQLNSVWNRSIGNKDINKNGKKIPLFISEMNSGLYSSVNVFLFPSRFWTSLW